MYAYLHQESFKVSNADAESSGLVCTVDVARTHGVQLCVPPPLPSLHLPSPAVPVRPPYQHHQAGPPPGCTSLGVLVDLVRLVREHHPSNIVFDSALCQHQRHQLVLHLGAPLHQPPSAMSSSAPARSPVSRLLVLCIPIKTS